MHISHYINIVNNGEIRPLIKFPSLGTLELKVYKNFSLIGCVFGFKMFPNSNSFPECRFLLFAGLGYNESVKHSVTL